MSETKRTDNYKMAKREADKVDEQIIEMLQEGASFRVEAGAGSGKTYSLIKAVEWIQENKWRDYNRKKQNVICITYTNAAVDVIKERLSSDSFILPSTIHSFAWNAIKQYQSTLIRLIEDDETLHAGEEDVHKIIEVQYTLGHRYQDEGIHYLYHDDVLKLFGTLLDNSKFRHIFSNKFPLILIDEYQDSYEPIISRFLEYFISKDEGPQFVFFGDAWQTIYQTNKACGVIEHENLQVIMKKSNFRSAPKIVRLLNHIRPDLPQLSAIDECEGEVQVITCDDYSGVRRTDRNFKGDLPIEELRERISVLEAHIRNIVPPEEKLKVLMITHKLLAAQQGYDKLFSILGDDLREKQDPVLLFFMNRVEPIYTALQNSDMQLLFDTLGKWYPIRKKQDKTKWKEMQSALGQAREGRGIDVLSVVAEFGLIPMPPQVNTFYQMYFTTPGHKFHDVTIKEFFELDYSQFLCAIGFLCPEAEFSTEHGVKGEEYDNVIFVIGRGWIQYQFDVYAPMMDGTVAIPKGKEDSFERNRNLFYVCCSRAKKRLIFFITVEITSDFRAFLYNLVGEDNVITYSQLKE